MVECERILSNLLERTSETHRDYNELSKMVAKFKQVGFFLYFSIHNKIMDF